VPFLYDTYVNETGSWDCRHVDWAGQVAPATTLYLAPLETPADDDRLRWARQLVCPECGTLWRVWSQSAFARGYVGWPAGAMENRRPKYRRSPVLDIDRIIAATAERLVNLTVTQLKQSWPGDDDGVWWFKSQGEDFRVQLESSTGQLPFIFEHDGMESNSEARQIDSHDDAVKLIVETLEGFY
jgi:hypothetical protein